MTYRAIEKHNLTTRRFTMLRTRIAQKIMLPLLGLLLVGLVAAGPSEAAKVRGQVQSILIEDCGATPGTCVGDVTLLTGQDKKLVLEVTRDTDIMRAGEPIVLAELAVGQLAKFTDVEYEKVGNHNRAMKIRQAP